MDQRAAAKDYPAGLEGRKMVSRDMGDADIAKIMKDKNIDEPTARLVRRARTVVALRGIPHQDLTEEMVIRYTLEAFHAAKYLISRDLLIWSPTMDFTNFPNFDQTIVKFITEGGYRKCCVY